MCPSLRCAKPAAVNQPAAYAARVIGISEGGWKYILPLIQRAASQASAMEMETVCASDIIGFSLFHGLD